MYSGIIERCFIIHKLESLPKDKYYYTEWLAGCKSSIKSEKYVLKSNFFHMRKLRYKEAKRPNSYIAHCGPPVLTFDTGSKRHQADDNESSIGMGMPMVMLQVEPA